MRVFVSLFCSNTPICMSSKSRVQLRPCCGYIRFSKASFCDSRLLLELYRELLIEIATLARLKYGGYAKGRGASYAEGFVAGLRAILHGVNHSPAIIESSRTLRARIERDANGWLKAECDITLVSQSSSGRSGYDPSAAAAGRADGKARNVTRPGQLRLN